jgi:ferric-dicitrate binding protein FerR (iron transport regulator)
MQDQQLDEFLRMAALTAKRIKGTISREEESALDQWIAGSEHHQQLFEEMRDESYRAALLQEMDAPDIESALRKMSTRLGYENEYRSRFRRSIRYVAAATVAFLLVCSSLYVSWHKKSSVAWSPAHYRQNKDIAPGRNGAVLTLANGTRIVLDSLDDGVIATQGGTKVVLNNRRLAYTPGPGSAGAVGYNIMTTPKGRQFELVLPDGTRVWLNAASSLHYPTAFTGRERVVEIIGEAYFEVAHNERIPFKVKINNATEIEVLGTNFNVNAYNDEPVIKTTLLSGSVKVTGGKKKQTLIMRPGQQSEVDTDGTINLEKDANTSLAVAWKEGRFEFQGSIQDIMRQVARWYDVEVVYEGDVSDKAFGGAISKYENVSRVLQMLELTGTIHFKMETATTSGCAGKVIVRP